MERCGSQHGNLCGGHCIFDNLALKLEKGNYVVYSLNNVKCNKGLYRYIPVKELVGEMNLNRYNFLISQNVFIPENLKKDIEKYFKPELEKSLVESNPNPSLLQVS
jgi:hypothetical protein